MAGYFLAVKERHCEETANPNCVADSPAGLHALATARMNFIKDVSSAKFFRMFHGWSTIIWAGLIPITVFTGLKGSIVWIALMSVWANFVGHFSSWQASRVEVNLEESDGV